MRMFAKFVLAGIAAGFLLFVYDMARQYLRGRPEPTLRVELKDTEKVKTVISPSRIESLERTRDGTVRHTAEPNYHHGTEVVVNKDGSTKVLQKTRGFSNDFGLSLAWRSIGVANEFVYYKNLSVLGGSQFINLKTQRPQLNLWLGIGYRLTPKKFNNVSVYTGIDTDRRVTVGLFLRLGNS